MIAKDSKLIISVLSKLGEQGLAGLGADLQCFGPKMSKEDSTVYNLKVFNSRQIIVNWKNPQNNLKLFIAKLGCPLRREIPLCLFP